MSDTKVIKSEEIEWSKGSDTDTGKRHRCYVFTHNNYTDATLAFYEKVFNDDSVKYAIYGKEIGKECKTPHLQGYVRFENARSWSAVQKNIFPHNWFAVAKGTDKQATDYCKKDKEFTEFGKLDKQGARSDLLNIKKKIIEDKFTVSDLIHNEDMVENFQQLKFAEGLSRYVKHEEPKPKKIIWSFGTTGTGKTHDAIEDAKQQNVDYWISGNNLNWFDGYVGQPIAIIDDFRGNFAPYCTMLRILDKYKYSAPIKGGFTNWNPETIYITSCYPPWGIYVTVEDVNQLMRRITEIREYTEKGKYTVLKTTTLSADTVLDTVNSQLNRKEYKRHTPKMVPDTEVGGNNKTPTKLSYTFFTEEFKHLNK